MNDFAKLMNPTRWMWLAFAFVVLLALTGGVIWYAYSTGHTNGASAGQLALREAQLDAQRASNASLLAQRNRIDQLTLDNQENQRAYQAELSSLNGLVAGFVAGDRLRDKQRDAIIAAARTAAAGACDRGIAISERHLEGVEGDAKEMGRLAVRALAKSEGLERTLRSRQPREPRQPRTTEPE